ncbi:MAG: glycosyltransferase [Chloroflexi bacterium AL-N10]|nr:glycosyltransferase [Chloroflexi bacterium AL-N10]NOK92772.1 glycosyltransferase [Chloroflexi bacterium AL-N15]
MNDPKFSSNIITYLKPRTVFFRYLVVVNLILGAWYLYWRINYSINWAVFWLSIPLLLAEIYSYLGGVMFLVGMWRPIIRKVKSFIQMSPPFPQEEWPVVDVFITCYNEPVEIVEKTAQAALNIDYPQNKLFVYILDDGNSPEIRTMAETLGIRDLKTSQIQAVAQSFNHKINQLKKNLKELNIYLAEIKVNEKFLPTFSLEVQSIAQDFEKVLNWVDGLKKPFIDAQDWYKFKLALGEGFDNVIKYAHKDLPTNTPIKIEVNILSNYLVLKIWDRGEQFDLETYLAQMPENVEEMAEGGRGFLIFQKIAEYLSYVNYGEDGNCLLMFQKYSPKGNLNYALSSLRSLEQTVLLLNPKYFNIIDYLLVEKDKIEAKIKEQESKLIDLIRCRYIAREKPAGKPHHAKAGNINNAIFSGETFGDFILTLDADHVPKPEIIQRVLPYFYKYNLNRGEYEPNPIAFVQTPQAFNNIPKGDPFGHQAHLFYGPIQQSKDGMGAAFYTGTNAVLRRDALISVGLQYFSEQYSENEAVLEEFNLVGGLSSNSITEDMNTAMRLHNAGWKSAYHHEELAFGLAPDDLSSTLKQKLRWAQGTIQVLQKENPWAKSKLNFWQQLQYFQTMYSYFSGFFIFVFIICPIIFFYTNLIPVKAYGADFAIHFIPAFLLNRLTFMVAAWGIPARELWRSEQYAIALFPLYIQSVWSILTGKSVKFEVTPKQRQSGIYLKLVWVQLSLVILTVGGIILSLYRWLSGNLEQPELYLINAAWAIYNMSLLLVIIRAAVWQPKSN